MRMILALALAGGLSLGMATTSHAQVAVGVNPWGGVSVVNPGGFYSSGYYGMGGVGVMPGTTVYSSGFGVAPVGGFTTFRSWGPAPLVNRPFVATGVAPVWGVRRGMFGRPRMWGFW